MVSVEARIQFKFEGDGPDPGEFLQTLIKDCFKFRDKRHDLPKFTLGVCKMVDTKTGEALTGPDAEVNKKKAPDEKPKRTRTKESA